MLFMSVFDITHRQYGESPQRFIEMCVNVPGHIAGLPYPVAFHPTCVHPDIFCPFQLRRQSGGDMWALG